MPNNSNSHLAQEVKTLLLGVGTQLVKALHAKQKASS